MLIDARSVPAAHAMRTDVCIVGAGAAGLTMAHQLARKHLRVLVLESGGRAVRDSTQRLYEGAISGRSYYPLDACRFRVLGGATCYWGGWCRPLDPTDFEARDWIAESGWPFGRSELEPLYQRAQAVCLLGTYDYDPRTCDSHRGPGLVSRGDEAFQDTIFQIRPTRFGEVYGAMVQSSTTVDLLLNANVLEVGMDQTGRTAIDVRVATLRGNHFSVGADVFVLAAGGIENPRILLCSRMRGRHGVGNEHDLVGRYFADHLHVPIGVLPTKDQVCEFYRLHDHDGIAVRGAISLTEEGRRRARGLGFAVTLHDADDPQDVFSLAQGKTSYRSLQALVRAIRHRQRPDRRMMHHLRNVVVRLPEACTMAYRRFVKRPSRMLLVGCRAEQAPNHDSRVTLDDCRDEFGMPKVRLEWRLSRQDLSSLRRAQSMLARAIRHESLDMFPFRRPDGTGWGRAIAGGAHHMGTTRMHRDPRHGVVDEDCRVHGTTNLYVAGSSVFPTGGWAPPTLTVVALALRLAEHIAAGGSRARS